jgi:hypothetical protein
MPCRGYASVTTVGRVGVAVITTLAIVDHTVAATLDLATVRPTTVTADLVAVVAGLTWIDDAVATAGCDADSAIADTYADADRARSAVSDSLARGDLIGVGTQLAGNALGSSRTDSVPAGNERGLDASDEVDRTAQQPPRAASRHARSHCFDRIRLIYSRRLGIRAVGCKHV